MLVVRNLPVLVHEGVGPFGVFVVNGGVNEYVQPRPLACGDGYDGHAEHFGQAVHVNLHAAL